MKAMKGKAMKKKTVSKIARGKLAKVSVFNGRKEKTVGGLTRAKLTKNKFGKIVSKAASVAAKKRYATSGLKKWFAACKAARKELGIKGFCCVGGKSVQGKRLYAKAKSLYQ